jgi:DNA mismatch repair ATPase MutS
LKIDDRDLQYLEYLLGKIEDKAFAAAERIGNLTEQADLLMSKAETSRGAIDKILGDNLSEADKELFDQGKLDQIDWQSYIDNETFTETEVEELLKQADELLAYNEELFALSDQVHEELQNSFAEWNEEIEKGIALFDHYDSIVDHL